MDEQQGALASDFAALADQVRALSRAAQAAEKALKDVRDAAASPRAALTALEAAGPALAAAEALAASKPAQAALRTHLDDAVARWRLTRLTALKHAATGAGLAFEQLTADEVRLGEATVGLDLDAGTAEVRYAREPLATVPAEPETIVAEVRKQLAALAGASPEPSVLFDELMAAYRAALARRRLPAGERVELLDLLPELFVARQAPAFWQKPDPKRLRPVTRAQLAYDLDHLQRARALSRDGLRIVLGTATGGTAAKKSQVLFLESGGAGGQYYLTFAARRVEE